MKSEGCRPRAAFQDGVEVARGLRYHSCPPGMAFLRELRPSMRRIFGWPHGKHPKASKWKFKLRRHVVSSWATDLESSEPSLYGRANGQVAGGAALLEVCS